MKEPYTNPPPLEKNMSDNQTDIDKHFVGGKGHLLDFIKQSQNIGAYEFTDSDVISYLKKAASFEDKDARDLVTEMVRKMEYMSENGDELRKRFATTHTALDKINNTIKSRAKSEAS